jgi:hypothetical protein
MKAHPQPISKFFTKGLYHGFPGFGLGSERYRWFKCHGFNLNLNFTSKNIKSFQIFNIMAYAIYSMISRQSAIAGQRYGFYLLGSSLEVVFSCMIWSVEDILQFS